METSHELLTPEEVQVLLRKPTLKAVYAAIERGQVPGVVRIGRSVLVRAADLRKSLGLTEVAPALSSSSLAVGAGPERT